MKITEEMKTLLPCPFCGNDKLDAILRRIDGYVECNNCGCRKGLNEKSPEIQALEWNTRHTLQPSPQPDTFCHCGAGVCGGPCSCKPDTVTKNHSDLGYIIPDQPPINNGHVAEGCEQFSQEIVDLNKDTVTISRESLILQQAIEDIWPTLQAGNSTKGLTGDKVGWIMETLDEALSLLNAEGKV